MTSSNLRLDENRRSLHGVGVGLRAPHFNYVEEQKPDVAWFEVLIDNYLNDGSPAVAHLERICQDYPVTFHGVGMSIGSTDELNLSYLKKLKQRITEFEPALVSDHLCWTSVGGHYAHDLLPLPYVQQAIDVVVRHVQQAQDFLGQRISLENVSSYLTYKSSVMQEWEFLNEVAARSDCDILLDINNIYVSARNHDLDALTYLEAVPTERVKELHLAGYEDMQTHLLDTHGEPVHEPVWDLYQQALQRFGALPTLIEWDNNIPSFDTLMAEADKADRFMQEAERRVA